MEEPKEEADARALGAAVHAMGKMRTAEMAEAIGEDKDGGSFKRAKIAAANAGYIAKVRQGVYRPGEVKPGLPVA